MRKAKPKKRVILPDPVYNDTKVSKFVNHLMYDGKKNTSYEIFYAALNTVGEKMKSEEKPALEIWKQALDNITPHVEVKSRRIGGATFQVPTEIRPDRRESISWTHTTTRVVPSSVRRICTAWLRLTVHSHISVSNLIKGGKRNG